MAFKQVSRVDVAYDDKVFGQLIDPYEWNNNFAVIEGNSKTNTENINENFATIEGAEGAAHVGIGDLMGGTEANSTVAAQLITIVSRLINTYSIEQINSMLNGIKNDVVTGVSFNPEDGCFTVTKGDGTQSVLDTNIEKIPVSVGLEQTEEGNVFLVITNFDGSSSRADVTNLLNVYSTLDSSTIAFTLDDYVISAVLKDASVSAAHLAPDVMEILDNIRLTAEAASINADIYAQLAAQSEQNASDYANLSKSYAIGEGGAREGESTDNSKYYCEQAQIAKGSAENFAADAEASRAAAESHADTAGVEANRAVAAANRAGEIEAGQVITHTEFNAYKDELDAQMAEAVQSVEDAVEIVEALAPSAGEGSQKETLVDADEIFIYDSEDNYKPKRSLVSSLVGALQSLVTAVSNALSTHTSDKNNPHGVTAAQTGAAASDHTHNYAASSHTHSYAGSSSAGGAATTALACTGNAATATKLATARNINGLSFDGSANRVSYGTCGTAAATVAKVVACTGFALITGAMIMVRFTVTNTAASPTLNVNSTGAKAIRYRNAAITAGYLAANRTYLFVYDGTYWQLVGDLDTNTTYTLSTITGTLPVAKGGTACTTIPSTLKSYFPTQHTTMGTSYNLAVLGPGWDGNGYISPANLVAAGGATKAVFGTYTGDGVQDRVISLGSKPKFVCVFTTSPYEYGDGNFVAFGDYYSKVNDSGGKTALKCVTNGFSVGLRTVTSITDSNRTGSTYTYFALI